MDAFLPRYKIHGWELCGLWLTDGYSGWLPWHPISRAPGSNRGGLWMKMGLCLCFVAQHGRPAFGLSQALAQLSALRQRTCWGGERGTERCRLCGSQELQVGEGRVPMHGQHCPDMQAGLGKEKIYVGWMDGWMDGGILAHTCTCYTTACFPKLSNIHRHKRRKRALQPLWGWVRVPHYATHIPSPSIFFLFHP